MKPMFCILAALLLSFPLKAQEAKLLSYTREFDITGMDAQELLTDLFHSCQEYTMYKTNYQLGDRHDIHLDQEAMVLDYEAYVENYTHVNGLWKEFFGPIYDFRYTMSIAITGDILLFEMSKIHGCVNGYELNNEGWVWGYMTEGNSGVRRGLYGPYWRRHDRLLRGHLQEFFDNATQLLYDSVTD